MNQNKTAQLYGSGTAILPVSLAERTSVSFFRTDHEQ
jgi:hypothetical protein